MIIPMLCVTLFVELVARFLLPSLAGLTIHTPTPLSLLMCLGLVPLMAVCVSLRCTPCGHLRQASLTLGFVVRYAVGWGCTPDRRQRGGDRELPAGGAPAQADPQP